LNDWTRRQEVRHCPSVIQQSQFEILRGLVKKNEAGEPITVAVQGFGNVGSVAALEAARCKKPNNSVVAVSDQNVTLYHERGLDIERLVRYAKGKGALPASEEELKMAGVKAELMPRAAVLTLPVDVLFLAAIENQITEKNMAQVQARVIVEGANAPVTGEADRYLHQQGKIIIPDILANAGGVIVSYLEWKQDRIIQLYTEEEVFEEMYQQMARTFEQVFHTYFNRGSHTIRHICYVIAVKRLVFLLYRHGKLY
jgi:glutamate dehydrogenase (NAD(P)+)